MFVLIAGGGRTGGHLANLLVNEGYKVRLVENRSALLARVHQELPTEVIYEGNPIDPGILEQAGIRTAHVLAAVTSDEFEQPFALLSGKKDVRRAAYNRAG